VVDILQIIPVNYAVLCGRDPKNVKSAC
jgi:hypothetical protein